MRNERGRLAITLAIALFGFTGTTVFTPDLLASPSVLARDDWKKEFEDICSQTQDAMLYTPEVLKGLVGRCDALKPRIEKLDESQKKIYLKRLLMCRDLFAYAIESKSAK